MRVPRRHPGSGRSQPLPGRGGRRPCPSRARIAAAAVAILFAAAAPAFAVVPSLTPVLVALVPQLLLLLATAFLVLVRPRTWFRAAAWSVRHPLHALAGLAMAGGLGWGGTWLFSGSSASAAAAAAAAAWEPPKPACGYEGQFGGPGHTYASDSRGADPVGPNLEPDVRWIQAGVAVGSVTSDGTRVFTLSEAGCGYKLDAWRLADGRHLWSAGFVSTVGPPLVPADRSGRVLVVQKDGELLTFDCESGRTSRAIGLGPKDEQVSAYPAFCCGRLIVQTTSGISCHAVGEMKADRAEGDLFPLRQWQAEGYGSDRVWLVLDNQSRAFIGRQKEIACLDLMSGGREIWRCRSDGRLGVPAWSAGWLYIAHAESRGAGTGIVCVDPESHDGAFVWRLPLPGLGVDALLAVGKGRIVVPVASGGGCALAVVDTTRRAVSHTIPLDAPLVQPLVLADAGDGAVFVLDTKNRVSRVALKAGLVSWTVDLGAAANGPMILADGMLLVPTDKGVAVLE